MTSQRYTIFWKSFEKHEIMADILRVIPPCQLFFEIYNANLPR